MTEQQTTEEDTDDQLTRADLRRHGAWTPIAEAGKAGRLDVLLGLREDPTTTCSSEPETEVIGRTEIERLGALGRHDLIEEARATDRINYTKEN